VDCVGLIIVVAQRCGLLPLKFEITDYGRLPTGELIPRIQKYCSPLVEPMPGAMLAIKWNREVSHVGLYTGETLIHAFQKNGKVVEHSLGGKWPQRIDSAWALPGAMP
jgi:hypothetical protein